MKVLKTLIIVLIIAAGLTGTFKLMPANSVPTATKPETTDFSALMAYDHVKYLVQKIGPRPAGSKSELKAAQYIYYVLQQNGWKVREQPFSKVVVHDVAIGQPQEQVELINSQNIIAELPGTRPDTIIIGAHYDTASFSTPGAVDNASGVGELLELARVLGREPHEETYQLVFFGAEEYGLVGSEYFASQADLSAVRWMLNLDMIGTPLEIDVAGKQSAPSVLVKQVAALAGESHIPFHVSRDFILMTRDSSQGGTSDFSPFLDQGIPALGLGIYGRPPGYYHRPEDQLAWVSMDDMQKIGDFTLQLLSSVKLDKLGPHVWDELYLPFQAGNHLIILPSYGIRIMTFLTFLLTLLILIKSIKTAHQPRLDIKKVCMILGTSLFLSLIVVGLSGTGEFIWQSFKQVKTIFFAYPILFIAGRIGIALGIFLILASWLHYLPISRNPKHYWCIGVTLILGVSVILTLIRIDLALPFVFWLVCLDLQYFRPNLIFVLCGPYFIYWTHYELLNSQQWLSYYEALHNHYLIFGGIYSLILIPLCLAGLHVALSLKFNVKHLIERLRKPVLALTGMIILALGLVPAYSRTYPQPVVVREEWSGNQEGSVHMFSNENLPDQLIADFKGQKGNSLYVPVLNEKPPMRMDTSVEETMKNSKRSLEVTIKLNYTTEPYLISLCLASEHPFEVQTDEFLPMTKLPRKLQLKGVKQASGSYSIILRRTPPHKNLIHLAVETDSVLSCAVSANFPETSPRIVIKDEHLSADYQIWFEQNFNF